MKKLLKLYKMFYRLLRLKEWQRREIERKYKSYYLADFLKIYSDYFEQKMVLGHYKQVMFLHGINNPFELYKALEGCTINGNVTETENEFVKGTMEAEYNKPSFIDEFLKRK